jgi:hypothetical protein
MTQNVVTVNRLSKEVFDDFAKQFRPITPTPQTTPLEVAYALGIQAVLQKLREGLVVDAPRN